MGLFKSDLYRSFAVGFVLGAVLLFAAMDNQERGKWVDKVMPAAVAATLK
jgi:hypothetical protein